MKYLFSLILLAASLCTYAQKPVKKDAARLPSAKLNTQQILKTDSVYLTGKVANFAAHIADANSVNIIINDLAFGKQLTYRGKINSKGEYRLSFIKTNMQDVMLQYNGDITGIIVRPGDHMQVDFDAEKFQTSQTFSNDGAKLNQDAKAYDEAKVKDPLVGHKGNRFGRFEVQSASEKDSLPGAHKKFLTDRYVKESAFLTSFIASTKPGADFIKWASADLKYGYFEDLMRYTWLHPMYNKIKEGEFVVPESYYGFIKPADLDNPSAAVSSSYGSFVGEYGRYLAKKNFGKSYKVADEFDLFLKEPAGLGRDVMLSNLLYNLTQSGALDLVATSLDKYKANVAQPVFKSKVAKAYDDKVYLLNNYTMPVNAQLNNVPKTEADSIFSKIVSKYTGKVVYVDFWATWCSPCRAEMPNSKVLHEDLAGKDVVFLYLGVQSEEKTWKAAIAEMGVEGEHFLLSNNDFSAVSAKFQISGIPRYLLVDKKGRVVDETAKRPSDADLKKDINKLLAAK